MGFHENLRHYREKKGYTTKEIADLLGVAPNTYAGYEIRGREPKYNTLCKIADLLNVSTDELLGRENNILGTNEDERLKKIISNLLEEQYTTNVKIKFNGISDKNINFKSKIIDYENDFSIPKSFFINGLNKINQLYEGKKLNSIENYLCYYALKEQINVFSSVIKKSKSFKEIENIKTSYLYFCALVNTCVDRYIIEAFEDK